MLEGAADRLREERDRLHLNQTEFSKMAGVSKNTQSAYESGSSPITLAYLDRIAAVGVDVEYVVLGRKPGSSLALAAGEAADDGLISVPMHNLAVSAGGGAIAIEAFDVVGYWPFPAKDLREMATRPDQLHLLPVKGDSMSPTLNDGDWIMVDGSRRDWVDGLHVARFYEDLFVKRVQFEGRSIRLVSDNAGYRTIEIERTNEADVSAFEIIGRVIWKAGLI